MSDQIAKIVPVVLNDLARIDPLSTRFVQVVTAPRAPSSQAAADHADEFAAYAYDLSATFISSAADHLVAWRALLADARMLPTYAFISLCRAAHESAFVALWLMQPGLTTADRAVRGLAAQLDDYSERRKIEEALGITTLPSDARPAAERYESLLLEAERRGMTKPNKKGKQVPVVSLPSAVELFDLYEPTSPGTRGSFLYRLYSGYSHGKQWALIQGGTRATPFDESDRALVRITGNPTAVVAATRRAVNALDRAVEAYVELHQASRHA